jgi:hypothetical protein
MLSLTRAVIRASASALRLSAVFALMLYALMPEAALNPLPTAQLESESEAIINKSFDIYLLNVCLCKFLLICKLSKGLQE